MIVTLTPNPAIDQTYRVPRLAPGASHRVEAPRRRAGGKGVNTAAVLAQTGVPHCCVSAVDTTVQTWWQDDLSHRGIRAATVPIAGSFRTRTSTAIVSDDGGATLLNETGAPIGSQGWQDVAEQVQSQLAGQPATSVLTICGSLPPQAEGPLLELVRRARSAGHAVVVDGSGLWLRHVSTLGPELVKCNQQEAQASTGEQDPWLAATQLLADGAQGVLISLGADGVLLHLEAGTRTWHGRHPRWRARPGRELHGNPTGAGDAATAAVAMTLTTAQPDPGPMLRAVVATSAAAVLQPVAGEVDPTDVQRLASGVLVERC